MDREKQIKKLTNQIIDLFRKEKVEGTVAAKAIESVIATIVSIGAPDMRSAAELVGMIAQETLDGLYEHYKSKGESTKDYTKGTNGPKCN